ncbi:hypothetical protein LSUE1_G009519, partial [Lachnellula suecica]
MKPSSLALALALASCSTILAQNSTSTSTSTCSLGIGRWAGSTSWDITIYNVPQSARQETNILYSTYGASMPAGATITLTSGLPSPLTITNVDNAPAFEYDVPEIQAPVTDPHVGDTKVELRFGMGGKNWTTSDCTAGSVVWSGGIESWSCDFGCSVGVATRDEKE